MSGAEGTTLQVGDRKILFLSHPPAEIQEPFSTDSWVRYFAFSVDRDATLPSVSVMKAILAEHCQLQTVAGKPRPTAPYLKLFPKYLFDWCEHY